MSYQAEEETLENMKQWWTKWGTPLLTLLLVVALIYAAWSGWSYWQRNQSAKAALAYQQALVNLQKNDQHIIVETTQQMQQQYRKTAYASMLSLNAAKRFYELNDPNQAKQMLEWIVDHPVNQEFENIARIHLATLLLSEKLYDQGLTVLSKAALPAFQGMVNFLRGQIFSAMGQRQEARNAYQKALVLLPKDDIFHRNTAQYHLDALGAVI